MREILHAIKRWIICKFEVEIRYNPLLDEVEYLRMELEKERDRSKTLMDFIIDSKNEVIATATGTNDIKPILPNYVPFHVRQKQLERESREIAKELKLERARTEMSKKSTEQLESELLGDTDNG